jgi:hypothetical protein
MNKFENFKSMNIDQLAEWLDEYGQFDSAPWTLWFDQKYCQNCEDIMCKYEDSERELRCAYCEVHNKCKFFPEMDEEPDNKEVIKMWLKMEAEDEEIA